MNCNCKWTETILAIILLIVTIWPALLGMASKWVVIVIAVVLLLHGWMCKNCMNCDMPEKMSKKKRR